MYVLVLNIIGIVMTNKMGKLKMDITIRLLFFYNNFYQPFSTFLFIFNT